MDPEEALGGDELEGFVERHDLAAEGARVAPGLAAPPEDLNEPPRVCRRPQLLREWGYDKEDVEPLFA